MLIEIRKDEEKLKAKFEENQTERKFQKRKLLKIDDISTK